MLLDKIRMRCTNLQEECHCIADILCHWQLLATVTERQQHNLVAGSKKGIPIPAKSHEGVNTRLHSLGY